jgi:hypothetical protein
MLVNMVGGAQLAPTASAICGEYLKVKFEIRQPLPRRSGEDPD